MWLLFKSPKKITKRIYQDTNKLLKNLNKKRNSKKLKVKKKKSKI